MLKTKLKGVTYEPAKTNIQKLKQYDCVRLIPYVFEKDGKVLDENAIKVLTVDGDMIGHIPKTINKNLKQYADEPWIVSGLSKYDGKINSVEIKCTVNPVQDQQGAWEFITPFNVDAQVTFYLDPVHKYFLAQNELDSVTRKVGAIYPKFDANAIAPHCEKKYGMSAPEIVEMWNMGGDIASGFGTAGHNAMELYAKYGDVALPKHPVLRNLVKSSEIRDFIGDDKFHTEALLLDIEQKVCGRTDLLIEKSDGLMVCDYKFNVEWDKKSAQKYKQSVFDELDNTKLSKFRLQMSVYSDILERSGHNVSDKVVAIINDGKWHYVPMSRIKGALKRLVDATE